MQGRGFNSFASNMTKLSVNETEWSSLLARTRVLIVYISIWKFDFGPETLPGLSRNGPQVQVRTPFPRFRVPKVSTSTVLQETIATTIFKAIVVTIRNNVAKKKKLQGCDALKIIAVGDGEQNIVIWQWRQLLIVHFYDDSVLLLMACLHGGGWGGGEGR